MSRTKHNKISRLVVSATKILVISVIAAGGATAQDLVEVANGKELVVALPNGVMHAKGTLDALSVPDGVEHKENLGVLSVYGLVSEVGAKSSARTRVVDRALIDAKCQELVGDQDLICEPNYIYRINKTPNDSSYSELWGMTKIGAPAAWDITTGSSSVIVAVIDTGVAYNHPDLAANIALNTGEVPDNGVDDDGNGYIDDYYGYNFSAGNGNPDDVDGHGTHCAGTIGGVGDNSTGVAGVNWTVGLLPVKVLGDDGSGFNSDITAGIDYARIRGAKVMNMSLGGPGESSAMLEAIERARDAGILVAAAAGNDGEDNDVVSSFPANYNVANLISVAASNSSDKLADFSNYGAQKVHIAAPGVSILSSYSGNGYEYLDGTSMATPHVAGVAALIWAANAELSVTQVKDLILNTATSVSSMQGWIKTGGRLNANAAVSGAVGLTPAPDQPGGGGGGGQPLPEDMYLELELVRTSAAKKPVWAYLYSEYYDEEEDETYYEGYEGYTVSLYCAGKLVRSRVTNEDGEVFMGKIAPPKKGRKVCYVMVQGYSTQSNNVRVSAPKRRNR